MALIEEYTSSGNWLFKKRSHIPLVLYIITVVVLYFDRTQFAPTENIFFALACFLISLFGLFIRVFAIGFSHKGTSGRNVKGQIAEDVNTSGIYSMVRHPLYLGNFFMWIGIVILTANVWLIITVSLLFWIYYERIMFAEEAFLRNKFGEKYTNWAENTPAFIPKFKGYQKNKGSFNLKDVIKREFYGLTAVMVSFAFIDCIKNYFFKNEIFLNPFYMYFAGSGILLFIILRFFKKHTKLLS